MLANASFEKARAGITLDTSLYRLVQICFLPSANANARATE